MVVLVKDMQMGQTEVAVSQILSNPILKSLKPGCRVTSFDVSLLYTETTGKKQKQYLGPFSTFGEALPPKILDVLKDYKGNKGQIIIEKIMLKGEGVELNADPIILGITK
jgi:hypothetical protein